MHRTTVDAVGIVTCSSDGQVLGLVSIEVTDRGHGIAKVVTIHKTESAVCLVGEFKETADRSSAVPRFHCCTKMICPCLLVSLRLRGILWSNWNLTNDAEAATCVGVLRGGPATKRRPAIGRGVSPTAATEHVERVIHI